MDLLQGPSGWQFLISEVPLYVRRETGAEPPQGSRYRRKAGLFERYRDREDAEAGGKRGGEGNNSFSSFELRVPGVD